MSELHEPTGEMRVPLRVWGRNPPEGALRMLRALASEPYVAEHVAAMPDLHQSQTVAVGTVFATERHLVPSALGEDLGCGVAAIGFDYPAASLDTATLQKLLTALAAKIPVGESTHRRGVTVELPDALIHPRLSTRALESTRDRLLPKQLRTLGGGNHFVELDRDAGGNLWVMVHSGSRGLGAAIGNHHAAVAHTRGVGMVRALALNEEEGRNCVEDFSFALAFARANRDALLAAAVEVVSEQTQVAPDRSTYVDLHHNFAQPEVHFGRQLWVHRKGAIAAPYGQRALIPGSMGTASYVVEGLAHPLSFGSASHGAGRVLTRTEARARVTPERLRHELRRVVYDATRERTLVEEAPAAYRPIGEVLEDEAELVRPVLRLEPIAVLKG